VPQDPEYAAIYAAVEPEHARADLLAVALVRDEGRPLRLEQEANRLLCSLRLTEDVTRPSAERQLSFTDADEVVKAVRDFVEHFARGSTLPGAPGRGGAGPPARRSVRRPRPG
jgi:hypothetical protein